VSVDTAGSTPAGNQLTPEMTRVFEFARSPRSDCSGDQSQ
jgi:hypothetical protein